MSKKIISLILMGMLTVPMVGCNINFKLKDPQHTNEEHMITEEYSTQEETKYSDEQLIKMFNDGIFTLTYDNNEYKVQIREFMMWLFGDTVNVTVYENSNDVSYIYVSNSYDEYAIFTIDMNTGKINIAEIGVVNDTALYGEQAEQLLVEFLCEYVGVGQQEPQPQPKQEEQGKDPMEESNGRHMESTAPYGRCPSCNAANASDKSYQGNYCDDCYAYIKQKEYEEKHQYGDCVDCGVYLTENQANSYGGRCPDCYARYYGDNDTHMGSCERCGDRVDLDHTNEGWGYNHLCSACTGELQAEESAQDATPYAG